MNLFEQYSEEYIFLQHLIQSPHRPGNLPEIVHSFSKKFSSIRKSSEDILSSSNAKTGVQSYVPHTSWVERSSFNKFGEFVLHYQVKASLLQQLLLQQKKLLNYTIEFRLKLTRFQPVFVQKNDFLYEFLIDTDTKNILLISQNTREKNKIQFQTDVIPYQDYHIELVRSNFLMGY